MEKNVGENAVVVLNEISKLVQDIEKKVLVRNAKPKECEEFKTLKEKCCDRNPIISISGFHGIRNLVERKILVGSQTISMLVSLLPSISQHGALVTTIGNILLFDLKAQTSQTGEYKCPYRNFQHPFILILKYSWEKSWFEIYHLVLQLMQTNEDIKLEHRIEFLRPIFHQVFWRSSWRGSQVQLKLFSALMLELHEKKMMDFALEVLLWQELDVHYCLFLQDFFINLLRRKSEEEKNVISGMTPSFGLAIKWLIKNGYDPGVWLKLLGECLEVDGASGSTVLCILTDVIIETPSSYINQLINVCKSIIISTHCSKYVVYKFVGVILNWFVRPSFLANPLYKTLEEILDFITKRENEWNDQTLKLYVNRYYKEFGSSRTDVKIAVDLILTSNSWSEGKKTSVLNWLKNLADSDQREMQFHLHSFIHGIILCENEETVIKLCLDILFKLIEKHKEISFSLLCLLFYKLGRETNPNLQKIYLFCLPKLSVKKENIPLIVGIIESLKRGSPRIMTPLVIQLYLSLWKFDNRTFSYLHKMLHDNVSCDFAWELNVSKAIALREICRLSPHLHAKDLVGVLSRILNECSGSVSGIPSAIAIEAVTDLCKAYVIDVAGTWNAIQPKLRSDKRPSVISSLCRFFGETSILYSSGHENEDLTEDIVSMLWNYTFVKEAEIVRVTFRALSKFPLENLPLKLLPEIYRIDVKCPKNLEKNLNAAPDVLNLSYVPAECWIQFLEKIDDGILQDGGKLISALLERELTSMPRGLFYLPPEKAEPLSYSYLPPRSICRCLVEVLQKHSKENPQSAPNYLRETICILSQEYFKLLPPLNWRFLESLMGLSRQFLHPCFTLLAKQSAVSSSAKSILENYFVTVKWHREKLEEILFIYNLIPPLCKCVSYNVLQNFLEETLELCLNTSLNENTQHFENLLQSIRDSLKNKSIQPGHKKLIAKQLEKVLVWIPADHRLMRDYAKCATEFPVQSVEELTSVKGNEINVSWLRRAVTIRCAIALRSDIRNPLVWLNEFTEAVAHFPNEQNFVLNKIWYIIRSRRSCDHRSWVQELTWRIQASVTDCSSSESTKVTLFLVDVFVTVVVILSGYDYLFVDADNLTGNHSKKLEIFPQALSFLFSFPDWRDLLPKVGLWLQRLLNWKHLPEDRVKVFVQALLTLREVNYYVDENESANLFNLFSV